MMKHILTLILALSVLFLTGCDRDANAPTGYKTASGEAADYYFFVPDDWTVDMATGATSAYCSAEDPSSVSVMAWELPNTDTTLDQWWEMNLEDITMVFQNVTVEEPENVTVGGVHGQKYVYTADLGDFSYKIMQTAAIRSGSVYLITYTSLADTFDMIKEGTLEVDDETAAEAAKEVADDGYWGVEQTSERLFSFAKALAGNDPAHADTMLDALQKGFDEATKAWGGELPDLCKRTLEATQKKINDWKEGKTSETNVSLQETLAPEASSDVTVTTNGK